MRRWVLSDKVKEYLNRREFLNIGIAPFLFFKNNSRIYVFPKERYYDKFSVDLLSYKVDYNNDKTIKLTIETKEKIGFGYCNYSYNDVYVLDKEQNYTIFIKNIIFDWVDIKIGRFFYYGFDLGEEILITKGIKV